MEPIMENSGPAEVFRISGHQSFALRIAWIPKAVLMIITGSDLVNVLGGRAKCATDSQCHHITNAVLREEPDMALRNDPQVRVRNLV